MKKSYLIPMVLVVIIVALLAAIVWKDAKHSDNSKDNQDILLQDITAGPDTGEDRTFRFSFTDNGYSIIAGYDTGEKLSGLKFNYLTKSYISKAKSTTKFGFLDVVNNYVPVDISIEDVFQQPLVIKRNQSILIYHVHALEGYCATEEDKFRLDVNEIPGSENNVVYVGDVMKDVLQNNYSVNVIRNATVFDRTGGSDATYLSAIPMLNQVMEEYGNVGLIVDVHRNAIDVTKEKYGPVIKYNDVEYAPISFLLGMNWPYEGDRDESVNPFWRENMKLTMLVAKKMNDKVPGIVENISLRRNPYNQNVAPNSLLVEIGFDGNLTSQAEATARLLAEVLGEIYG